MRGMFGLVALLVGVGLVIYIFANREIPTAREGKKAQEQVETITGRSADGAPVSESVKIESVTKGSSSSLKVTEVTAGGFFDKTYGLQAGDVIVQIGEVTPDAIGGGEAALAMLYTPAQYQKLVVDRGGQRVTLTPAGGLPGQSGTIKIPLH